MSEENKYIERPKIETAVEPQQIDIEDENIMLLEISDSFVFHYIVKKINIDKNSNITITTNELKSNELVPGQMIIAVKQPA